MKRKHILLMIAVLFTGLALLATWAIVKTTMVQKAELLVHGAPFVLQYPQHGFYGRGVRIGVTRNTDEVSILMFPKVPWQKEYAHGYVGLMIDGNTSHRYKSLDEAVEEIRNIWEGHALAQWDVGDGQDRIVSSSGIEYVRTVTPEYGAIGIARGYRVLVVLSDMSGTAETNNSPAKTKSYEALFMDILNDIRPPDL